MPRSSLQEYLESPEIANRVRASINLVGSTGLPHHFTLGFQHAELRFTISPELNPFPSEAEFYLTREQDEKNSISFGINISSRPFISRHHVVWVYSGNPMTQKEFIRLKPLNPKGYLAILEQRGTRVVIGDYNRDSGKFSLDYLKRFFQPFAELV